MSRDMWQIIFGPRMAAIGLLAITGLIVPAAHSLEAIPDAEMSAITGQEGVQVSLEYYYNSVRTDDPTTTGQGLASCTNGGLGDMDCRLSWQLSNRGDAANQGIYTPTTWTVGGNTFDGEWLVWKGGWMSLAVNGLNLDASFLGGINGAVSAGASYEGFLANNLVPIYGSFVDSSGDCLMPAGYGLTPCSVAYLKATPALRTHYASAAADSTYCNTNSGGSCTAAKTSVGYNDVRFGLEVVGLSAEYDVPGGNPGWMNNGFDSFASLKIADNNGHQAGIAFGGNFYLYGF